MIWTVSRDCACRNLGLTSRRTGPYAALELGGGGWHISKKNEDLIIFVYFTNCMGVRKEGQVGQLTPLALYVFLVKMYLGNFHQKLLAAVILTASCNQKGLF